MNDDFLLAIVVLSMLSIFILMIGAIVTGFIYFVALYLFQFNIERPLLDFIYIVIIFLAGITTYWRINKC